MKRRWWWAVAGLLALVPLWAVTTHQFTAAGLQFDTPDGWTSNYEDGVLTVKTGDEGFELFVWVVAQDALKSELTEVGEIIGKHIKDAKVEGDVQQRQVNGLIERWVTGTGQHEGHEIVWEVAVVWAEHPVVFLSYGTKEAMEKHKDDLNKLDQSIRKL